MDKAQQIKLQEDKLRNWIDLKIQLAKDNGDDMFMGVPDKWYQDIRHCCSQGHISRMYLKSEIKGCVCLSCYQPTYIFPSDATEEEYRLMLAADPNPMDKAEFINEHFPKDVVRNLHKSGFFTKSKMTVDEIEARVCQWFGLESIFDYAKIGEGSGVHLSLTKRGRDEQTKQITDHEIRPNS